MFQELCIIVLCFSSINGERWYSASLAENEKDPGSNHEFPQYADKFEHIPTFKNENPVHHKWHFRKPETLTVKSPQMTTTETSNFVAERMEINRNNSFFKNPVRKIGRKRCPSRPRKQGVLLSGKGRKGRFLELFQVVEFDRVTCSSSSGLEGVCLHEYECEISGGTSMGTCADGFGTCCVIDVDRHHCVCAEDTAQHTLVDCPAWAEPRAELTAALGALLPCDTNTAAQSGWFTNPGFPSPSAVRLSCTLALNKTSEDIAQIRLDFDTFELLPPTAGSCESDQFVIAGQNINNAIPILCGINNGQHVYIEVGDVMGPILLTIQTVTAVNRLFAIKVSQLTAFDRISAPSGCLQYYREPQGYLESFNYAVRSNIDIAKISSYMNNLDYAICIERASKSCSITYANTETMQIVNYDEEGVPVIPAGQAGVEIFNCPEDYLSIGGMRLCGDRLNDGSVIQDFGYDAPVTDTASGPIVVWFKSNGGYVGQGFKLEYQQNNCTN